MAGAKTAASGSLMSASYDPVGHDATQPASSNGAARRSARILLVPLDVDTLLIAAAALHEHRVIYDPVDHVLVAGDPVANHLLRRAGEPAAIIGKTDQSRCGAETHRSGKDDVGFAGLRVDMLRPPRSGARNRIIKLAQTAALRAVARKLRRSAIPAPCVV